MRAISVELLYFPPPSISRNICANTNTAFDRYSVSIFKHPHASTVINSTTYWSDKAYLRYQSLSAYKYCELSHGLGSMTVAVGKTYLSHLVELESIHISSICDVKYEASRAIVTAATAIPFNFDDLHGEVPASAYQCMRQCIAGCDIIVTGLYRAELAVPQEVCEQDPEWASCIPPFDGVIDPSIALGTIPPFFSTTATNSYQTQAPFPGQSVPTIRTSTIGTSTQSPLSTRFTETMPVPSSQPFPPRPGSSQQPSNRPRPDESVPGTPMNSNSATNNLFPLPTTNQPIGPTSIAIIGNSVINTDPSRPGTVIIANPAVPGSAQTITPGGIPVIVSSTTISVNPTNGIVIVSGGNHLIPIGTVGGSPVYTDPSRPGLVIVGDPASGQLTQTLTANGPSIVIDGTTMSLSPAPTSFSTPPPAIVSGITISRLPDGTIVINNSQTLQLGGTQTIDGHIISMDTDGTVFVDGQQVQVPITSQAPSSTTISGISLTRLPDGSLLINGETILRPGDPQVSIDGHSIRLSEDDVILVNGQEVSIPPASPTLAGELLVIDPDETTSTLRMMSPTNEALAQSQESISGNTSTTSAGSSTASTRESSASTTDATSTLDRGTEAEPSSTPRGSGSRNKKPFWALVWLVPWPTMIAVLLL